MRAYSRGLRERILAAKREGATTPEVAARYRVHATTTIDRYAKRERETGSLAPKPIPGRRPKLDREHATALAEQVAQHHDITLAQHRDL